MSADAALFPSPAPAPACPPRTAPHASRLSGKVGLLAAACSAVLLSAPAAVHAAPGYPFAFKEEQPDGSWSPPLHILGGPRDHYVVDDEDFVVITEADGDDDDDGVGGLRAPPKHRRKWKVYADRDKKTGKLVSSHLKVGKTSPRKAGLLRQVQLDREEAECRTVFCDEPGYDDDARLSVLNIRGGRGGGGGGGAADSDATDLTRRLVLSKAKFRPTGTVTNLVVLVRFADHRYVDLPSEADIGALMNAEGGHPKLAPTGSLLDYFRAASYGKLTVRSVVTPWTTISKTERYCADGASGTTARFEECIREALDALDSSGRITFDPTMDRGGDAYVDSAMVLFSGYGAEWGKTDCRGASVEDRIWSHQWHLRDGGWCGRSGYCVDAYHTTSAVWGTCGTDVARIGTMAHEIGHTLGLADLYAKSNGVGSFSLMGNSWGFDGSQHNVPLPDPWSRIALGWAKPTVLAASGTYEIKASAEEAEIFMIREGYAADEYLLIENRQPVGFDGAMPQGGLAIYKVDELAHFTSDPGYPGQEGWPQNGNHYRIALLQADGSYDLEQNINRGDGEDVWHASHSSKVLGPPLTDSYQGGIIKRTNHRIENISFSGNVMKFDLLLHGQPAQEPQSAGASLTFSKPTGAPIKIDVSGGGTDPNAATTTATKTIAATSPSSTAEPSQELELRTPMDGSTGSYGCVFDVVAKAEPIVVTALSIHTRIVTKVGEPGVKVEVRTKEGGHDSQSDPWNWRLVASTSIKGMGYMVPSHIPGKDFDPVAVLPGQTQAFYVTLLTADLRYTKGEEKFGAPIASNRDLDILMGSGIGNYPKGPSFRRREFNGIVKYRVGDDVAVSTGVTEPVTTNEKQAGTSLIISSTVYRLETTFDANNGAHGSMFHVHADADVIVTGLDIHTRAQGLQPVEIYTKVDSYKGFEDKPGAWTQIFSDSVRAQGPGKPTKIAGTKFTSVSVSAGKTRAFYVTMKTSDIRYTNGDKSASDGSVSIEMGDGVGAYKFPKKTYPQRSFNGAVYYTPFLAK